MLCYKMHPKTKTPMGHISWKKKAVIYLHVSKIAPFETGTHFIAYQYGVNTWKLHPYQSKIYIYSFDFYRIFSFPPAHPTHQSWPLSDPREYSQPNLYNSRYKFVYVIFTKYCPHFIIRIFMQNWTHSNPHSHVLVGWLHIWLTCDRNIIETLYTCIRLLDR